MQQTVKPISSYDIKELIPHREPMLLIDEIVSVDESGEAVHARKTFLEGDRVFEGHFPGEPILPGMLTIESMAQAAAALISIVNGLSARDTLFYFMAVDGVKFREMVRPGETLDLYLTQTHKRGHVYKFFGVAKCNDRKVAEASFTAKWDKRP